jgi:hypothetical protein
MSLKKKKKKKEKEPQTLSNEPIDIVRTQEEMLMGEGGGEVLFFRNFHCTMSLFVYCTAYSPSEIGRTQVLSFSLISFFVFVFVIFSG